MSMEPYRKDERRKGSLREWGITSLFSLQPVSRKFSYMPKTRDKRNIYKLKATLYQKSGFGFYIPNTHFGS